MQKFSSSSSAVAEQIHKANQSNETKHNRLFTNLAIIILGCWCSSSIAWCRTSQGKMLSFIIILRFSLKRSSKHSWKKKATIWKIWQNKSCWRPPKRSEEQRNSCKSKSNQELLNSLYVDVDQNLFFQQIVQLLYVLGYGWDWYSRTDYRFGSRNHLGLRCVGASTIIVESFHFLFLS